MNKKIDVDGVPAYKLKITHFVTLNAITEHLYHNYLDSTQWEDTKIKILNSYQNHVHDFGDAIWHGYDKGNEYASREKCREYAEFMFPDLIP